MQIFLGVTPYLTGKLQHQGKLDELHHVCFDYQTFGEFIEQHKLDAVYLPYHIAQRWIMSLENSENNDVIIYNHHDSHQPQYALSLKNQHLFDTQHTVSYRHLIEKIQLLIEAVKIHNQQHEDIHSIGVYLDNELSRLNTQDAIAVIQHIDSLATS
jgi:hypothetical protein